VQDAAADRACCTGSLKLIVKRIAAGRVARPYNGLEGGMLLAIVPSVEPCHEARTRGGVVSLSNLRPGGGGSAVPIASGAESPLPDSKSNRELVLQRGSGTEPLLPRGKSMRMLHSILGAVREPLIAVEPVFPLEGAAPGVLVARVLGLNDSARRILDELMPGTPVEWLGRDLVEEVRWLDFVQRENASVSQGEASPGPSRLRREALQCLIQMLIDARPRSFSMPADGSTPDDRRVEVFVSRMEEWPRPLLLLSLREFVVPSALHLSRTHSLLARFSHEVRSPLTSVVLAFQQLGRILDKMDDGTPGAPAAAFRTLVRIGREESEKCRDLADSWLAPAALEGGEGAVPEARSPQGSKARDAGAREFSGNADGETTSGKLEPISLREIVLETFGKFIPVDDRTMNVDLPILALPAALRFAFARYAESLRGETLAGGPAWMVTIEADARVRQVVLRVLPDPHVDDRFHDGDWRQLDFDLISYRLQGRDGSLRWWDALKWRDLLVSWGWKVNAWVHGESRLPQADFVVPLD
jgi:signal transduction histidine kinase